MPQIAFQEFRDENRDVSYPFIDNSSLTDTTGTVTIPKSLFIDASFYFPGAEAPLFLHTLTVKGTSVTITVMDNSRLYEASGEVDDSKNTITLKTDLGIPVGLLVSESGKLTALSTIAEGTYTFLMKDTSFVPRCVIPMSVTGITSVGLEDQSPLYGDIWLCGGNGVIIRKMDNTTKIRFDIVGDPLFKQTMCGNSFSAPNPLRTINGHQSDEYGTFIITTVGGDVLRVKTEASGITISAAGF